MSNKDDLDWLARNVHEWPSGDHQPWCYVYFKGGNREVSVNCITVIEPCVRIEKAEWLSHRSELKNKPGWADAPEWAQFLSQNCIGLWCFTEFMAWPNDAGGWSMQDRTGRRHAIKVADGEEGLVLGDWRDTLERRPADLSEAAVTERLDEATQNVLAAAPALKDEKYRFECEPKPTDTYKNQEKIDTSAERVQKSAESMRVEQESPVDMAMAIIGADNLEPEFKPVSVSNETVQLEQPVVVAGTGNGSASETAFLVGRVIDLLRSSMDHFSADELADLHDLCDAELTKRDAAVCGGQKYLDAHWHERGELPPVGTKCLYQVSGKLGYEVEITAHAKLGICFVEIGKSGENYVSKNAERHRFLPIRTEKQELIEVLKGTHAASLTNLDMLASAILAAGFKRESE